MVSLTIILKQVSMRLLVGMRKSSVSYPMLMILLIKILCIFIEAIQIHGSFSQMMNEWRIQLSIFSTKNGLLLNLRIITFITELLICTMVRILFSTIIIIENVKDVWYIPLILLMNNIFSIFRCVEYCVCYWLFVRLSCYKNVQLKRWKWNWNFQIKKMLTINKLSHGSSYNVDNIFLVQRFSAFILITNSTENLWTREILSILYSVHCVTSTYLIKRQRERHIIIVIIV